MKAKHTIARIQGASIWQKIFCALIAASLVLLMVPNGLRANAGEQQNSQADAAQSGQTKLFNGPITNYEGGENQAQIVNADDLLSLGSTMHIDASSYNSDATAGTFTVQTIKIALSQLASLLLSDMANSEVYKQTGSVSKADFTNLIKIVGEYIASAGHNAGPGGTAIPFDQLDYYTEYGQTSVDIDMTKALQIPEFIKDSGMIESEILSVVNAVVPSNTWIYLLPEEFTNDGSLFVTNVFLGFGNNILDVIRNGYVQIKRVIPVIPAFDPEVLKLSAGNLAANNGEDNAENAANVQAYFMNWNLDLWGNGSYMPISWWQSIYDDERMIMDHNPLPIYPLKNVKAQAMFYDIEGLVPVHLNFSDGFVEEGLAKELLKDGWYTTDFVNRSVWTKNFFEWTPTWYISNDIFTKFGKYIYSEKDDDTIAGEDKCGVVKDEVIRHVYVYGPDFVGMKWDEKDVPFPGPHWFECDNENWFGTVDKETTFTFSVYPLSPRGNVVHAGHGKTMTERISDVVSPVDNAIVMFYNQWGFPLFSFEDQGYGGEVVLPWYYLEEFGYYFAHKNADDTYTPQYCYDTQIDHATVFAWDEVESIEEEGLPDIYVPLYVTSDQFDASFAGLYDYRYLDFSVERLMYGDLETLGQNDGIESFKVEYLEDGNLIAEPFTISNPWEIAWFGLPMVTHGTITTWRNTLVSGFGCFMDYAHPFDADPMTLFQDQDNFTVSNTIHWYQCRITANAKPGYEFSTWYYDRLPVSADVEGAGEDPIIVREPLFFDNHTIRAGFNQVAGAAIYGDDADNAAIYGESVAPVAATPDGNASVIAANPTADGAAQTGDSMGFAFAIIAMIAIAGAGVLAGRKLYNN